MRPSSPTFVALLVAVALSPAAAGQMFGSPQIPTGSAPQAIASGDLNADGRADLITANKNGSISVLLGAVAGGFGNASTLPVAYSISSVAVGDFDADGKLDVAAANAGNPFPAFVPGSVEILPGDGTGGFGVKKTIWTQLACYDVAVGDFNGDGKLDVATASALGLIVQLGNGAGGITSTSILNIGPTNAVAIGDLDGNGYLDLVATCFFGLARCRGDGLGGFPSVVVLPTAKQPVDVALDDVNGDGALDIVTTHSDNGFYVLLGNGAGAFSSPAGIPVGVKPLGIAIADLNGDGNRDVVMAVSGANSLAVRWGDGAGGFLNGPNPLVGLNPTSVLVADLDGDSLLDVAATNSGSNTISIFSGPVAAGFPPVLPTIPGGSGPRTMAIGDLNGDGHPDLVASSIGNSSICVRLSNGSGGFINGPISPPAKSIFVALADVNGDGILDLAATPNNGFVVVELGDGAGGFGNPVFVSSPLGSPSSPPWYCAIGDLNADGIPDLAMTDYGTGKVGVALGNGVGGFGLATGYPVATFAMDVAIGDLNGDGLQDLVVGQSDSSNLSVLLGTGGGAFGPTWVASAGSNPKNVALTDLNGDGKLDVVVVFYNGGFVKTLLGTGTGTLIASDFKGSGGGVVPAISEQLAIADFDGDGRTDVAASIAELHAVAIWKGDGNGGFAFGVLYTAGPGPTGVAAGDLDGDGYSDLAVSSESANTLTVLWNQTLAPGNVALFGSGTSGCSGDLGMAVTSAPRVNSPNLGITASNAPRRALGLGILGNVPDFAGSDPFLLGLDLHVDFAHSSFLYGFDLFSDGGGSAFAPFPLPNDPFLAGKLFVIQSLWLESATNGLACSGALLHLVSSKGLAFVVLP